jgi:hypothetical protein
MQTERGHAHQGAEEAAAAAAVVVVVVGGVGRMRAASFLRQVFRNLVSCFVNFSVLGKLIFLLVFN